MIMRFLIICHIIGTLGILSFLYNFQVSGVTLILMLFGMECSKIYMSDDKAYRKVIIMKAASISCLIGGFMLLWLCCVYAAQIKYEYFYDQQHSVFIGSEV